jgi:hypothetical protein
MVFVTPVGSRNSLRISAAMLNVEWFLPDNLLIFYVFVTSEAKHAISKQKQNIAITYRRAFPHIYIVSVPYKDELPKIASLPSLLFLSPASSSRLMTLRFVTASALDDFSTCIPSSTHVLSPHPSIVNSVFSKINLLAIAHSHFMLHQAIKGQTYKGITVNMTDMPKKKTSVNMDEGTWKQWLLFVIQKHGSSRRVSEETTRAIKEYMKKHGDERIDDKCD